MSPTAHAADPRTPQARSRMMWVVLGALVTGQLFAFWLLCSHQVRKAEARSNQVLVRQLAMADCLQYIPGSTIGSCSQRLDPPAGAQAAPPVVDPAVTGAVPVSFTR